MDWIIGSICSSSTPSLTRTMPENASLLRMFSTSLLIFLSASTPLSGTPQTSGDLAALPCSLRSRSYSLIGREEGRWRRPPLGRRWRAGSPRADTCSLPKTGERTCVLLSRSPSLSTASMSSLSPCADISFLVDAMPVYLSAPRRSAQLRSLDRGRTTQIKSGALVTRSSMETSSRPWYDSSPEELPRGLGVAATAALHVAREFRSRTPEQVCLSYQGTHLSPTAGRRPRVSLRVGARLTGASEGRPGGASSARTPLSS